MTSLCAAAASIIIYVFNLFNHIKPFFFFVFIICIYSYFHICEKEMRKINFAQIQKNIFLSFIIIIFLSKSVFIYSALWSRVWWHILTNVYYSSTLNCVRSGGTFVMKMTSIIHKQNDRYYEREKSFWNHMNYYLIEYLSKY